MVRLTLMLVCAAWCSAAAQVCVGELQRALPPADATPAQVGAALLARASHLIEPAFPPLHEGDGPVAGAGAAAGAVHYLHRRGLLPEGWTADDGSVEAWGAMLARFVAPYRVAAPAASGVDRAAMLHDAARALEVVAGAVRPLAVIAVDRDDRVTLFVVIWNWTPYPRLLAYRPPPGLALVGAAVSTDAVAPVLAAMSGCALRFERFIYAAEDVAVGLFVAQGRSTLRWLGSDPPVDGLPRSVESGDVVDVLTFRSTAVDGASVVSVAIEGTPPGLGTLLAVLLRARSNVGADGVWWALALP